MSSDTSALWRGIARADETAEPEPRDMLRDLYGEGAREGSVDTKVAAAELGVSQRTVQRWVKDGKVPGNANGNGVREAHQQWRKGPDGRQAAMNPRRENRLRNKGTTLRFNGKIKISGDKRGRNLEIPLKADDAGEMLDALLAGNDDAALDILTDVIGEGYFAGNVAIDELSDFDLSTFN